jgi:DNA-directed RNA polymerase omega subunit
LDSFGNIDSKFRFIILASKRAKQLLRGAKPKIRAKSRNLIRIAQAEVRAGLIEFEVLPERRDDIPDVDDRMFVGGGIPEEIVEPDGLAGKETADDTPAEEAHEALDEEEETEESEPHEELEEGFKEDKDE